MIEELELINHWLDKKDPFYFRKLGIDKTYFVLTRDIVEWIENFRDQYGGTLPTKETVAIEFEDFKILTDLNPESYLVNVLRENKAYMEYRPILTSNAQMVHDGRTIEALYKMRNDVDRLLKQFSPKMSHDDWVKNALDRYQKYMEKHGKEDLAGISTGIKGLDAITGGWRSDDMILLAGRMNEGKSLVAGYFGYHAWLHVKKANMVDPIVHITTEMPRLEVAYRLDTLRAHFSNRALMEGKLADPDLYREYLESLSKESNGYLILDNDSNGGKPFTPQDILAVIESERPAFIIIDQLYDLSDGTPETDIRKRIVNISSQIREVNLYTQTPTMLLAQAGRESAKEARKNNSATPELDQIQESDNPAQKATKVITIRNLGDIIKLSLKKHRGGERNKDIFMRVSIDTGIWEEVTENELVF